MATWMTLKDLAEYLQFSKEKIYHLARSNSIPCYKIGSQWRFKKEEIDRWVEKKKNRHGSKEQEAEV